MKLKYCKTEHGNFGDDLNLWLWSHLLPGLLDDDESTLFLGVGTILDRKLPAHVKKVVFGSGVGYKKAPKLDSSWQVYGVRGEITAARLGLGEDQVIGDPACLLHGTHFDANQEKRFPVSYIPHHDSLDSLDWGEFCQHIGYHFISPRSPFAEVIEFIKASEVVVTEAMHGAIFADALRVPWIPARYSSRFLNAKWEDWLSSVDLKFSPIDIDTVNQRELGTAEAWRNRVKRALAAANMGKEKWRRLPLACSSKSEIRTAADRFSAEVSGAERNLSSDTKFFELLEKQKQLLEQLRNDYM